MDSAWRRLTDRLVLPGWAVFLVGVIDWIGRIQVVRDMWQAIGLAPLPMILPDWTSPALIVIGLIWVGWRVRPSPSAATARASVGLRAFGNTAGEPWVRWYHAEAFARTDVIAPDARVRVRRDSGDWEEWQWAGARPSVTIGKAPMRIPLVIGGVADNQSRRIATGWLIELGIWRWTPTGHAQPSTLFWVFQPRARHRLDVEVRWVERGREMSAVASFELRFGDDVTSEPNFVKLEE